MLLEALQQISPFTSRWLNLGHVLVYTVEQMMGLLWLVKTNQDPTVGPLLLGLLGGTMET